MYHSHSIFHHFICVYLPLGKVICHYTSLHVIKMSYYIFDVNGRLNYRKRRFMFHGFAANVIVSLRCQNVILTHTDIQKVRPAASPSRKARVRDLAPLHFFLHRETTTTARCRASLAARASSGKIKMGRGFHDLYTIDVQLSDYTVLDYASMRRRAYYFFTIYDNYCTYKHKFGLKVWEQKNSQKSVEKFTLC